MSSYRTAQRLWRTIVVGSNSERALPHHGNVLSRGAGSTDIELMSIVTAVHVPPERQLSLGMSFERSEAR